MIRAVFALLVLLGTLGHAGAPQVIRLHQGYITRLNCQGSLVFAGVGDPLLVEHQELPKELGCTVILKPLGKKAGRTNLVLESTAGSLMAILEIVAAPPSSSDDLTVNVGGTHE